MPRGSSSVSRTDWEGHFKFTVRKTPHSYGRGSWVVGTKSWVVGRGYKVVGRGSWVVGRGSWIVEGICVAKTNDEQQSRT